MLNLNFFSNDFQKDVKKECYLSRALLHSEVPWFSDVPVVVPACGKTVAMSAIIIETFKDTFENRSSKHQSKQMGKKKKAKTVLITFGVFLKELGFDRPKYGYFKKVWTDNVLYDLQTINIIDYIYMIR